MHYWTKHPEHADTHRSAVHRRFLEKAEQLDKSLGLPRRITVFGISSLPPQTLEALATLSEVCQILLMVTNPCRHYWTDIIEDRELLRTLQQRQSRKPEPAAALSPDNLHLYTNPLLASWGRQLRDYIGLLDNFDAPTRYRSRFTALERDIDLFTDPGQDTLLHQVQQAILDLEPLPPTPSQRRILPDDTSLRFPDCPQSAA